MEYDKTQFFSDVGGAAGLLLGISLTSLFGMLDSLIWLVVQELSFGTYRPEVIAKSSLLKINKNSKKFCVRNKNRIRRKLCPSNSNFNDQAVSCDLFEKDNYEERRQSVLLGIYKNRKLTISVSKI